MDLNSTPSMFAYCNNCPIVLGDSVGLRPMDAIRPSEETPVQRAASFFEQGSNSTKNAEILFSSSFNDYPKSLITSGITANPGNIADPESFLVLAALMLAAIKLSKVVNSIAVNRNEPKYYYWEADLIHKQVVVGNGLSLSEASARVAMGKNLMCANEAAARTILFINGYVNAVGPEKSNVEGAFYHFHPNRNTYPSVHIWFYS